MDNFKYQDYENIMVLRRKLENDLKNLLLRGNEEIGAALAKKIFDDNAHQGLKMIEITVKWFLLENGERKYQVINNYNSECFYWQGDYSRCSDVYPYTLEEFCILVSNGRHKTFVFSLTDSGEVIFSQPDTIIWINRHTYICKGCEVYFNRNHDKAQLIGYLSDKDIKLYNAGYFNMLEDWI